MLFSSRRLFQLTRSPKLVRFSSSCNNKVQLETSATTTTTATADKKQKPPTEKLHFMPVINIPETELAHHAFFSLHRPLLGLSDQEERPFFSGKSIEEYNQEKLDMELNDYLMDQQPFVEPGQPKIEQEEMQVSFEIEDVYEEPMPVFHMPESNDILNFLDTIENKMHKEHAKLEAKESRQRKQAIIRRFHASKRSLK